MSMFTHYTNDSARIVAHCDKCGRCAYWVNPDWDRKCQSRDADGEKCGGTFIDEPKATDADAKARGEA